MATISEWDGITDGICAWTGAVVNTQNEGKAERIKIQ